MIWIIFGATGLALFLAWGFVEEWPQRQRQNKTTRPNVGWLRPEPSDEHADFWSTGEQPTVTAQRPPKRRPPSVFDYDTDNNLKLDTGEPEPATSTAAWAQANLSDYRLNNYPPPAPRHQRPKQFAQKLGETIRKLAAEPSVADTLPRQQPDPKRDSEADEIWRRVLAGATICWRGPTPNTVYLIPSTN